MPNFIEVFIDVPLEICEARDPKGLYKEVRAGKRSHFTGIDDPYEIPSHPDVHLKTYELTLEQSLKLLLEYLEREGHIEKISK